MRYPALSLMLMPIAAPASAHLEPSVHVHGNDASMWMGLIGIAGLIAMARYLRRH